MFAFNHVKLLTSKAQDAAVLFLKTTLEVYHRLRPDLRGSDALQTVFLERCDRLLTYFFERNENVRGKICTGALRTGSLQSHMSSGMKKPRQTETNSSRELMRLLGDMLAAPGVNVGETKWHNLQKVCCQGIARLMNKITASKGQEQVTNFRYFQRSVPDITSRVWGQGFRRMAYRARSDCDSGSSRAMPR